MDLDECMCAMPRGAGESRAFIARALGEGASIATAIGRTESEFDSLKPVPEPCADCGFARCDRIPTKRKP